MQKVEVVDLYYGTKNDNKEIVLLHEWAKRTNVIQETTLYYYVNVKDNKPYHFDEALEKKD